MVFFSYFSLLLCSNSYTQYYTTNERFWYSCPESNSETRKYYEHTGKPGKIEKQKNMKKCKKMLYQKRKFFVGDNRRGWNCENKKTL